jgi:hypothetical protein
MRQQSRTAVAEVVWKACRENGSTLDSPHAIECLGELNDPMVTEFLMDEAFAPEKFIRFSGSKAAAIRALAKRDRDSAFRACERAFSLDEHDRDRYPALLMEIDESRAMEILGRWALEGRSAGALHAIGRAFRAAKDQTHAWNVIDGMVQSDSPEKRMAGARLASWHNTQVAREALNRLAIADAEHCVRREAESAMAQLLRHDACQELLSSFENTSGCRSWSYLESAIKLGDPVLLSTRDDDLFLWGRLASKSPGMRVLARKLIKSRLEDLQKQHERADRDRNRN